MGGLTGAKAQEKFHVLRATRLLHALKADVGAVVFTAAIASNPSLLENIGADSALQLTGHTITMAEIDGNPDALRPAGFTGRMP